MQHACQPHQRLYRSPHVPQGREVHVAIRQPPSFYMYVILHWSAHPHDWPSQSQHAPHQRAHGHAPSSDCEARSPAPIAAVYRDGTCTQGRCAALRRRRRSQSTVTGPHGCPAIVQSSPIAFSPLPAPWQQPPRRGPHARPSQSLGQLGVRAYTPGLWRCCAAGARIAGPHESPKAADNGPRVTTWRDAPTTRERHVIDG